MEGSWGRVGALPNADYAATIPHNVFMIFQCMFTVITPVSGHASV
jgi:ammonia channel protein AmtB